MNKKINGMLAVLLLSSAAAIAAVPGFINFQGRLLDSDKLPRNGQVSMTFKICDTLAGLCGSPLWTESKTVTVTNGVFAVQLGSTTAIPPGIFSSADLYLDINVEGQPLLPREQLANGPYSFRASVADSLAPNVPVSSVAVGAVYGGAILDGAVTNAKLAGSITDGNLNQITTANKVATSAIANGTLGVGIIVSSVAANGVRPGSILAGAIGNADINAAAAISISKLATTGTLGANVIASSVAVGAVYGGSILDNAVTEPKISLSDLATDNVSSTQHGFAPKAPNTTTTFLRGDATWAAATTSKFVVKGADQSIPSGTTLAYDNALTFPVGAGETWVFEFRLLVTNNNSQTPDWKAAIKGDVGWSCSVLTTGLEPAAAVFPPVRTTNCTDAPAAMVNGTILADGNIPFNVYIQGWITTTNAGAVTLWWAPNTSGRLTVEAGSYVIAQKVGGI